MRYAKRFVSEYGAALVAVHPPVGEWEEADVEIHALTELCLAFLEIHVPGETVDALPHLLLGYKNVFFPDGPPEAWAALTVVRHMALRFRSLSSWSDTLREYGKKNPAVKCYDLVGRNPVRRRLAPGKVLAVLEAGLTKPVPWRKLGTQYAKPGNATVRIHRTETTLAYQVPHVADADLNARQHELWPRTQNPPLHVPMAFLEKIAKRVDERESRPDWPSTTLPPCDLLRRVRKLEIEGIASGVMKDGVLTLEGATHLVGMLSSGKSSLVLALIFALTLGGSGKRIVATAPDTNQANRMAERLRLHGIKATVLSSFRNREKHLASILWQKRLDGDAWSLASVGRVTEGFSTACPLDGYQSEPRAVSGEGARFPDFSEKPCHALYQGDFAKDCPLWTRCPAQEQQRDAVAAQVIIMTPQAMVFMTADPVTLSDHMSLPELFQYIADLVIVDEVDSVQKALDDIFSPPVGIMGNGHDDYAAVITTKPIEAIQSRRGGQYRKRAVLNWDRHAASFRILVGFLYNILLNESDVLRPVFQDTTFTAATILIELWRNQRLARGKDTFGEEHEKEFMDVVRAASFIARLSPFGAIDDDEDESEEQFLAGFKYERFRRAAKALRDLAGKVMYAEGYERLTVEVADLLGDELSVFSEGGVDGPSPETLDLRGNSLAVVLAVVTELALTRYHRLITSQPHIATDLNLGDIDAINRASKVLENYRTLLPGNPAGSIFGFLYEEPKAQHRDNLGGRLTLMNHLGVGRHLMNHMHDLLVDEGQAGPHTLLLSGTSWAGGGMLHKDGKSGRTRSVASPSFDVQVPVKGILLQPEQESLAIGKSEFSLVDVRDKDGRQYRVSGAELTKRAGILAAIVRRMATPMDGMNMFDDRWMRLTRQWGEDDMHDRRRALLVVNSYDDAVIVADELSSVLDKDGTRWRVRCLVRDGADEAGPLSFEPKSAAALPRSLVERFGYEPEYSILVAPLQVISRGHNILNAGNVAAISTIYFLHRPHPRPDDLSSTVSRLNRYAVERYDKGMGRDPDEDVATLARRLRHAASNEVTRSLKLGRHGYSALPDDLKGQFAWDMLTLLWQTIGRGIRGGRPVFVGFVDSQFAPRSFEGAEDGDTPGSSALVQCLMQLERAVDPDTNRAGHKIAQLLYGPFLEALRKTHGLIACPEKQPRQTA